MFRLFFSSAIICLLFSCAVNAPASNNLTLGTVQKNVQIGFSQTEILKNLGSPNIITKDRQDREVWTYDKISKEKTSKGGAGFLIFNPFTWFGMGTSNFNKSTSSSNSLTVIINFDVNKKVVDFSYQSLKY